MKKSAIIAISIIFLLLGVYNTRVHFIHDRPLNIINSDIYSLDYQFQMAQYVDAGDKYDWHERVFKKFNQLKSQRDKDNITDFLAKSWHNSDDAERKEIDRFVLYIKSEKDIQLTFDKK